MKKRKDLTISELDVEPIADEELAALSAASAAATDGGSYCYCIDYQSDLIIFCDEA